MLQNAVLFKSVRDIVKTPRGNWTADPHEEQRYCTAQAYPLVSQEIRNVRMSVSFARLAQTAQPSQFMSHVSCRSTGKSQEFQEVRGAMVRQE